VTLLPDGIAAPDAPMLDWALPPLEPAGTPSGALADQPPTASHLRAHLLLHVLLI
jgi:hypothetical protein